jgi:hypothetical protein
MIEYAPERLGHNRHKIKHKETARAVICGNFLVASDRLFLTKDIHHCSAASI